MKLKSYFADSVASAMAEAARELGPEAMLVNSREAPPEARHLGPYEVVFGVAAAANGSAARSGMARGTSDADARVRTGKTAGDERRMSDLSQEVAELRRQISRIAGSLARSRTVGADHGPLEPMICRISDGLLNVDLAPDLVHDVVSRVRIAAESDDAVVDAGEFAGLLDLVRAELAGMFSVDPRVGASREGAQVVAFVGPPGSGKTSALVKVAAACGLQAHKPAQLLSLDMYRVGGAEQLRSFAAILGIGFQALDTPLALAQSLEEHRHKDLILIDTPGHSPRDMDGASDLAAFLQSHPRIDVHLTLAASTKAADMQSSVRRFEAFRPTKLLFTKLDETSSPGTLLNESIRTGNPISFLTDGQQIPEDLREASKSAVLDLVLADLIRESADMAEIPHCESPSWERPAAGHAAAA